MSEEGSIWISIDDYECHYLKIICDEIFSRKNFICSIAVKSSTPSGPKTAHKTRTIIKQKDFILVYKKGDSFTLQPQYTRRQEWDTHFNYYYDRINEKPQSLLEILLKNNVLENGQSLKNFSIDIPKHRKFYIENAEFICQTQSFKNEEIKELSRDFKDKVLIVNEGKDNESMFYNGRQLTPLSKSLNPVFHNGQIIEDISNLVCDFWTDIDFQNTQNEGSVSFPNSKKPEQLILRILRMTLKSGDIVLDSFGGSGTTAAVAHKMGARWIMVEMEEHCQTLIIPRMKRVIDGDDQSGITKAVNWQGGGGFRYFKLAPTLLTEDKWGNLVINPEYNAEMLAEALCKLEGFSYQPSPEHYWQQGQSTESDFIYTTTQILSQSQLEQLSEEVGPERTLLVLCNAFKGSAQNLPNLTVKKIPKHVLNKCEWGKSDYSLQIQNLPDAPPKNGQFGLSFDTQTQSNS